MGANEISQNNKKINNNRASDKINTLENNYNSDFNNYTVNKNKNKNAPNKSIKTNNLYNDDFEPIKSLKPDEKLDDDILELKENSQNEDDNKSDNEKTNFLKQNQIKIEKIEDDKSIPNPTEKLKLYDLIIYCNSLEKIKNNGWYYRMSKDFEKKKMKKLLV